MTQSIRPGPDLVGCPGATTEACCCCIFRAKYSYKLVFGKGPVLTQLTGLALLRGLVPVQDTTLTTRGARGKQSR